MKKPKAGEEGKPDNENKGGVGGGTQDETPIDKYKRTCACGEETQCPVLEGPEQKGDIAMVEATYTWGLM